MKIFTLLLILSIATTQCFAQDSTQTKKPFSFKQVLENRQKKLDRILERENQAQTIQQNSQTPEIAYNNISKGANKVGGGIILFIAANILNLYITNPDTRKAITIGSGVVGSTLILIGTNEISEAGQILKRKKVTF